MSYTDEQLRAIEHTGGHSLTYAVAGSGKTHMLVGRVLFLLEQGIPAERIRVLAFNREAAKEFQTRLAGALPTHRTVPKVSTFHSLGLSLTALFEKQDLLPRRRLEASEAVEKKLAREAALAALKEEGSDEYPSQDAFEAFRAFIGLVKSDLLSAADAFRTFGLLPSCAYFVRAFARFEQARERAGLRFFADLLSDPVAVMRANSKALALVTNKLDVVVVDEFQDVSRVQVELLIQLVGTRAHLNAVGDDSQCIYAWRGARPEIMGAEFARHFPGATRYTLSRTFRFGHRVSLAAAQLIGNNRNRMDTLCVSAPSTPDTGIEVIRATSAGDQSAVLAAIDGWRRAGRSLRAVAVLARLWAQTLSLELALLERDIPYVKAKDDLFRVPEIAGLLGYLRLAAGTLFAEPRARDIVRHMLATPTLWLTAATLDTLADAIVRAPAQAPTLLMETARQAKKPYHAVRISERAEVWHEALSWADLPAAEALRCYAARTDLVSAFATAATSEAAAEKELAYQTLLDWAVRTRTTVGEFVARMDALRRSRERYEAGGDAVLLSSIHQVKGREFPLVIVTGLEDGLFPSRRASAEPVPEEERRLAYVAMTRAQERLLLVVPPDARFDAAWLGTPTRGPGLAKIAASSFAFEANLRTSSALGEAITRRLSGADPGVPLPEAALQAAPVLNRYLGEVGLEERYQPPAKPPTAAVLPGDWGINDRVRHPFFGDGLVVGIRDQDILDINFGGTRRSIKSGVVAMERV
jgi:DNA helicase-2/ATP-dependent DNA helicase PcrA